MLYQLDSYLFDGIILVLDFAVVGLLVYLFRQPRDAFYKWWAILALVLLTLPLTGIKLLRTSPGSVASSPGLITIHNPEQRMAKLYYLHRRQGAWQVDWVEYMVSAGKETVVELEGNDGLEVAYQQAGQWYYAPAQFTRGESIITFPQDFSTIDTSGRIEAAVNKHILAESLTWLSHLLTLGSIGLVGLMVIRGFRRLRPSALLAR